MNTRIVLNLCIYALLFVLAFLALLQGNHGAMHVLSFCIWILFALTLPTILNSDFLNNVARDRAKSKPMPGWMRQLYSAADLLLIGSLVWFGHIFLGLAWLAKFFASDAIRAAANNFRQQSANSNDAGSAR